MYYLYLHCRRPYWIYCWLHRVLNEWMNLYYYYYFYVYLYFYYYYYYCYLYMYIHTYTYIHVLNEWMSLYLRDLYSLSLFIHSSIHLSLFSLSIHVLSVFALQGARAQYLWIQYTLHICEAFVVYNTYNVVYYTCTYICMCLHKIINKHKT